MQLSAQCLYSSPKPPTGAAWAVASDGAAGLTAGAAALGGTARAGRAVGGATSHALADQALWLYIIPADALEVLRTSAVKAAKAAQAVAKFFLQMCDNVVRHRLTLGLRAGRAWSRVRAWLRAAARTPQALLQALRHWLLAALRWGPGLAMHRSKGRNKLWQGVCCLRPVAAGAVWQSDCT